MEMSYHIFHFISQGLGLMSLDLGICFTSPKQISVGYYIPNSRVMWNIGTSIPTHVSHPNIDSNVGAFSSYFFLGRAPRDPARLSRPAGAPWPVAWKILRKILLCFFFWKDRYCIICMESMYIEDSYTRSVYIYILYIYIIYIYIKI